MSRLILFPRRNGKTKSGDASADAVKAAKGETGRGEGVLEKTSKAFPIVNVKAVREAKLDEAKKEGTEAAYKTLREARADARYVGARAKRAAAKAEAEESKKK